MTGKKRKSSGKKRRSNGRGTQSSTNSQKSKETIEQGLGVIEAMGSEHLADHKERASERPKGLRDQHESKSIITQDFDQESGRIPLEGGDQRKDRAAGRGMEPSAANEPSQVNGLPTSSSAERAMLREEESYERLDGHKGVPLGQGGHGTTVAAGSEDAYDAHVPYEGMLPENEEYYRRATRHPGTDVTNGAQGDAPDACTRVSQEAERIDHAHRANARYDSGGVGYRNARQGPSQRHDTSDRWGRKGHNDSRDQHDKDNGALRAEISKLKTQNSELKDKEEYQSRQLKELNEKLRKVVDESLAVVDRFQPEFDENLVKDFNGVDAEAQKLATLLNKELPSLEPKAWSQEVMHATWSKYRDMLTLPFTMEKSMRKWLLKGVVWKALHDHVFQYPFQAYGTGEDAGLNSAVDSLNAAYSHLWPSPRQDETSVKWRSMTAEKLARKTKELGVHDHVDYVLASFNDAFKTLGYSGLSEIKDGRKRMLALLEAAVALAQKFATQRAILELWEPTKPEKVEGSKGLTNVLSDADEEREGRVWFVVSPALVKYGTGKGEELDKLKLLQRAVVVLE